MWAPGGSLNIICVADCFMNGDAEPGGRGWRPQGRGNRTQAGQPFGVPAPSGGWAHSWAGVGTPPPVCKEVRDLQVATGAAGRTRAPRGLGQVRPDGGFLGWVWERGQRWGCPGSSPSGLSPSPPLHRGWLPDPQHCSRQVPDFQGWTRVATGPPQPGCPWGGNTAPCSACSPS